MGTTTEPVVGSGSWPACRARVEKPFTSSTLGTPGSRRSTHVVAAARGEERQDVGAGDDAGGARRRRAPAAPSPPRSACTAFDSGSVLPRLGSGVREVVLDAGRSSVALPLNSLSSRSRSVTAPRTSAAMTGGSALTIGICETPNSRMIATASATVSFGVAVHEVGDRAVLARAARRRPSTRWCRRQEAVGGHPLVVEDRRQVAAATVGQQHDDHASSGPASAATCAAAHDGHPAGAADQQRLLAGQPPGHVERVGVGDRDDLVGDPAVVRGRPEVLADALDQVGPAVAAGVHRADGVGADDLDPPVGDLLEVAAGARDGAAGADAGDEVRDAARRSAPRSPGRWTRRGTPGWPGWRTGSASSRRRSRGRAGRRPSSTTRGARARRRRGTRRPRRRRRAARPASPR